jgi:hypothetical protein
MTAKTGPSPKADTKADTRAPTKADTRLRRLPDRGSKDFALACAIIDDARIGHVGFALDGQPYVVPMAVARDGRNLLLHGSVASRLIKNLAGGLPCCVTVTHLDGLVLARSAFNSSMNYRSVMVFGTAKLLETREAKLKALEHLINRLYPGRWAALRAPHEKEIKATSVIAMPIAEASAKIRSGPPLDYDADMGEPVWAGVIPLALTPGAPMADPRLDAKIALPETFARYALP